MTDDTDNSLPLPRFKFKGVNESKNTDTWKTTTCGECNFHVTIEGLRQKPGQPEMKECRQSPPLMLVIPTMNRVTQQSGLQVDTQYPKTGKDYPACSKFIKK